jgi:hypothetical protein
MDMSGMDMSSMDMSGMAMPGHSGNPSRGGHAPDHESLGVCPFAAAASTMSAPHAESVVVFAHVIPKRLPRGPTHASSTVPIW